MVLLIVGELCIVVDAWRKEPVEAEDVGVESMKIFFDCDDDKEDLIENSRK